MNKIKVRWTKQAHTDKITIDKMKYVTEEALYCNAPNVTNIIINKHLSSIKYSLCIGEYSLNQDVICLFSDGIEYFTEVYHNSIEKQMAITISHEIMHRVLFYEQGENTTRLFDNIAEDLKLYGVW